MSIMWGQHLTEAICRNPKSREWAVLAETDKDLLTGLVSIPAVYSSQGLSDSDVSASVL